MQQKTVCFAEKYTPCVFRGFVLQYIQDNKTRLSEGVVFMTNDFSFVANANEYVFARAIDDINRRRFKEGKDLIHTSQALDMHDRLELLLTEGYVNENRTAENPMDIAADAGEFSNAMMNAVYDRIDLSDDPALQRRLLVQGRLMVEGYRREYEAITNVPVFSDHSRFENSDYVAAAAVANSNLDQRNTAPQISSGANSMIPISPFDRNFRSFDVFKKSGSVLYARMDNILSKVSRTEPVYSYNPEFVRGASSVTLFDYNEERIDGDTGIRDYLKTYKSDFSVVGDNLDIEDSSRISELKPYMTDKDYNVAVRVMQDYEHTPGHRFMNDDQVKTSVAVLKWLIRNGYSFEIKPDSNPGQLKANIIGTKIDIRIADAAPDERRNPNENPDSYIGRVYNDGMSMFYRKGSRERKAANLNETIDLISFFVGDRVRSPSGSSYIGQADDPDTHLVNGRPDSKSAIWIGSGTTNEGKPYDNSKPSFRTVYSGSRTTELSISTKNTRNSARTEFLTENEAESFLQSAVSTARTEFESRVNLAGLTEYADKILAWQQAHPDEVAEWRKKHTRENRDTGEEYLDTDVWRIADITDVGDFSFDFNRVVEDIQGACLSALIDENYELKRPSTALINANMDESINDTSDVLEDDMTDADLENGVETDSVDAARFVETVGYDDLPNNRERAGAYIRDWMDGLFGNFDFASGNTSFNPSSVSHFMNSLGNVYRNRDDLVSAMRKLNMDGSTLLGDDFQVGSIRDDLLRAVDPVLPSEDGTEQGNILHVAHVDRDGDMPAATILYTTSVDEPVKRLEADPNSPDQPPVVHIYDIPNGYVMRMKDLDSSIAQGAYAAISETISDTGCILRDDDTYIDGNGVVQYTAEQVVRYAKGNYTFRDESIDSKYPFFAKWLVRGTIGQIFEPNPQGIIETKYNGSENRLLVPGYNARIIDFGENSLDESLPDRIRLSGFDSTLFGMIRTMVRQDLMSTGFLEFNQGDDSEFRCVKTVGGVSELKSVYSPRVMNYEYLRVNYQKSDEYPNETLLERRQRELNDLHFPKEVDDARIASLLKRCSFTASDVEGSAIAAIHRFNQLSFSEKVRRLANDSTYDIFVRTGGQDLSVVSYLAQYGIADPYCTGSGKNQGKIFTLPKSASVNPDGSINPASDGNNLADINLVEHSKYVQYSPADRNTMYDSNMMTAYGIQDRVGIGHLTLKGFTYDDGCVISKAFAERMLVPSKDGTVRSAKVGDKLCDAGGNKSTISLVIDPDMDMEEAKAKHLEDIVKFFKMNPQLELVQAPYAPVSRFNGATAKFMLEDHGDLIMPDGSIREGGMGYGPVQMTRHSADDHTSVYTDDDFRNGKGRNVSALLTMTFDGKGCYNVLKECFDKNSRSFDDMRENCMVLGIQIDEDSKIHRGILLNTSDPSAPDYREVFKLPSVEEIKEKGIDKLVSEFSLKLSRSKGVLELPFELDFISNADPFSENDSKSGYFKDKFLEVRDVWTDRNNGFSTKTPVISDGESGRTYGLPIMSAQLRSGQRFEDGESKPHDYTNHFVKIYRSCLDYLIAENDKDRNKALKNAQGDYNCVADQLKTRMFDTKHNMARDHLLSVRASHSSTAVWTADPRLNLDQVAVSGEILDNMGIKDGEEVLLWRDPVWRPHGVHYVQVVRSDDITGISINPLLAKVYDGDFDGDSAALLKLDTEAAKVEAKYKLSIPMDLLDPTAVRDGKDGSRPGDFKLFINDSMDVASAEALDEKRRDEALARGEDYGETLRDRRFRIEREANDLYRDDTLTYRQFYDRGKKILDELSDWSRDALMGDIGVEHLMYGSEQEHLASVSQIVDHKAKGSYSKIGTYANNIGITYETDEAGRPVPDTAVDTGHPLTTIQDSIDVQRATAAKSFGTGDAGTKEQQIFVAARNISYKDSHVNFLDPSSFELDPDKPVRKTSVSLLTVGQYLTYLSTQGLLQAKHDPYQADKLYTMVNGPIKDLWHGYKMTKFVHPGENGKPVAEWVACRDKKGAPVHDTVEGWVNTFLDMHESDYGLELKGAINKEHLEFLANRFADKDGNMCDITSESFIGDNGALMDRLAYKQANGFNEMLVAGMLNERLYSGAGGSVMPEKVRKAIICEMAHEAAEAEKAKSVVKDVETEYESVVDFNGSMQQDERGDSAVHETVDDRVTDDNASNYQEGSSSDIDDHDVGFDEPEEPDAPEPANKSFGFDFTAAVSTPDEPAKTEKRVPSNFEDICKDDQSADRFAGYVKPDTTRPEF